MFEGSSRETIEAFKRKLERAHIPATVRLTRSRDNGGRMRPAGDDWLMETCPGV
jgi:hypothetical protein